MALTLLNGSRFMRATAGITLCFFLAGCIPGNLQPGGASQAGGPSMKDAAGGLLAQAGSLTDLMSSVSNSTGVALPGAKKGYDQRTWSAEDQASAERALAAFSGKSVDGLAVYDPLKPGEAARYNKEVAALVAKYGKRDKLSPSEVMEFADVVVPLMRFLVKSKTYRAAQKNPTKVLRSAQGNDKVVIPAFSTVEMAALTYCNDHGLPAPWRGEKLHMRPLANYIPDQLDELYKDLHAYAATNPSVHYKMQSLVWTLRDNPCGANSLSDEQKALIEAAHKGGNAELQVYCTAKKIKDQALAGAKNFIPGSSQLAEYQQYIAQAADYQAKADAFLKADLSDPAALLQLAQTAGLQSSFKTSPLLNNPQLKQALPLLKQSGLADALLPKGTEAEAVATSLGVMEELGRALGETVGADQGSIADYSDLGNGLYARAQTPGGASNVKLDVVNTSDQDLVFSNSDFALSSVDDPASGRKEYHPTQRLSIGPLQPIKVYPNDANAKKLYTEQNEKEVERTLEQMKDMTATVDVNTAPTDEQKVECPTGAIRWGDVGLTVTNEVLKSTPFLGNILNGYAAITGREWLTGEAITDPRERVMAALSAVLPGGAMIGAGIRTLKAGYSLGNAGRTIGGAIGAADRIANGAAVGLNAQIAYREFADGNDCKGWQKLASTASSLVCASASTRACVTATAIGATAGGAATKREETSMDRLFIDIDDMSYDEGAGGIGSTLSSGVDTLKGWLQ